MINEPHFAKMDRSVKTSCQSRWTGERSGRFTHFQWIVSKSRSGI